MHGQTRRKTTIHDISELVENGTSPEARVPFNLFIQIPTNSKLDSFKSKFLLICTKSSFVRFHWNVIFQIKWNLFWLDFLIICNFKKFSNGNLQVLDYFSLFQDFLKSGNIHPLCSLLDYFDSSVVAGGWVIFEFVCSFQWGNIPGWYTLKILIS